MSFYGLSDVENIEELVSKQKVKKAGEVKTLRVMHCNALVSLKGIGAFSQVQDLNLSSNSIMSLSFLETLNNVHTLNISCNKIT